MPLSRDLADALIQIIRARMAASGLSVNRLAGVLDVSQATLDRQLKGRGDLTIDGFEAIAESLGEPLNDLLDEARRAM